MSRRPAARHAGILSQLESTIAEEWANAWRNYETCRQGEKDNPDDYEWPTLREVAGARCDSIRRIAKAAGLRLPNLDKGTP